MAPKKVPPVPTGLLVSEAQKRVLSLDGSDLEPRKRHKTGVPTFADTSMVLFLIGPKASTAQKSFMVHKEVVCLQSPVLNAAFNSGFVEGQTQTYEMEDTTEGAFQLLLQYLYRGYLELLQLRPDFYLPVQFQPEDQHLNELWLLADKLIIPALQNLVLILIEEISNKTGVMYVRGLDFVWEHTSEDSLFRQYWVAKIALELATDEFDGEIFPDGFLLDVAKFHARRRENDSTDARLCVKEYMVWDEDAEEDVDI